MQEKIELQKKIELDPKEVLSIMMLLNSVITATALKKIIGVLALMRFTLRK